MKVTRNTLKVHWETWDDPGDYPSGAGGGPLPSHGQPVGLDGELVFEMSRGDLDCPFWKLLDKLMYLAGCESPVPVLLWDIKLVRPPEKQLPSWSLTAVDCDFTELDGE